MELFILLAWCGNVADKYERNLAASQPPPTPNIVAAKIFSPFWTRVGLEMGLDARGSISGTPDKLTYAWTLASTPVGSEAQIDGRAGCGRRL